MLEGKLVPGEVTVNLIKAAMEKKGWTKTKFLIDGFPRSQENQDGWDKIMAAHVDVKFVLFMDCAEETMIQRILKRGESSGEAKRSDDNVEVLQKRFAVLKEQSLPIVEQYAK